MTPRGSASSKLRAYPMIPRTRFLITAAVVCHLLFAHPLVTSQLLSPANSSGASQTPPNIPIALRAEDVTISAVTQEKEGPVIKLHGSIEIHDGTYTLHANDATYNMDTREVTADGNVVLDG